ncbi:MAG: response regulator [Deltaproteobacteria bacterium]|nr:MAG: response regulator [Deltaproteobacteria bacterium]
MMSVTSKVLIVDDEPRLCDSLKTFLSGRGYEITAVNGGKEAIELVAQGDFDLILLDMVMPKVGGDQVMDFIRGQGLTTSIIVMTGYASTDSVVESLRKGVYDYLRKPFDLEELLTTVENALSMKKLDYERKKAEKALQQAHDQLERRVEERTTELTQANEQLKREIDGRRLAEEALLQAHDELEIRIEERTAELARANDELRLEIAERKLVEQALRNSSEKLRFFAYSVIHDLKSPATAIYGLTELLHRNYSHGLDERGSNYCAQILKASEHVAALVEKINVYIAAKEAPLELEKISLKEIFKVIRDEFSPQLTSRQIEWLEPEAPGSIKADKPSLLRVFRNFVENALKHGGDTLSEIRIAYEQSKEHHILAVSDNGAGIRGGDYEGIFRAFRRDEASKAVDGAGLGLAIVREIAERHQGMVWATPGVERGTIFQISLSKHL